MPIVISKTYLTKEDLEREAAAVRNMSFGKNKPAWRRMICRALHIAHHDKVPLNDLLYCKCSRCGHSWTETSDAR